MCSTARPSLSYSNAAQVEQILCHVKGKITRESLLAATRKRSR